MSKADKDCPECGAYKIRQSVSLCDVCEVSQRYEKRLEQLQAMLDVAIKECDAERAERARLREALAAVDLSYQTGSVLPASVLQTLAEYHARILATWPERVSRDHGSN